MRVGQVRPAALHHPARPRERGYPAAAIAALACPLCGAGLIHADSEFRCVTGHVFDVARQGYVPLLGVRARTDTGDSADMVAARADFLGAGHFAPIAAAVAQRVAAAQPFGTALEIGSGTGHYLAGALETCSGSTGIALDSSKYAARRAAARARTVSVLADAWSALPIRSESVTAVLSIFAPRDPAEIARILVPGGILVAVTPEPAHLIELRELMTMLTVDEGKGSRLIENFEGLLAPVAQDLVEFEMSLSPADVSAVVRMGPTARHFGPAQVAAQLAKVVSQITVTASVTVTVLERAGGRSVTGPDGTDARRPG